MDSLVLMEQEDVKETQVCQASQVPVVWTDPLGQMDCRVPQVPLEPPLLPMDSSSHATARQQMHHNAHREQFTSMMASLSCMYKEIKELTVKTWERLAAAFVASVPCLSCSATSIMFATLLQEMTTHTGCPLQNPCQ